MMAANMLQRILVATDLSEGSEALFGFAEDLARRSGAQVIVVHIADPAEYDEIRRETRMGLDEYVEKLRSAIRRTFEKSIEGRTPARPIRVEVALKARSVPQELLEMARREQVDLIVLGTHGRTGLARVMLGSVAEEVLRHAVTPVLVVPKTAAGRPEEERERRQTVGPTRP
jgi:nucleotide-binding universal stress UspA family protein